MRSSRQRPFRRSSRPASCSGHSTTDGCSNCCASTGACPIAGPRRRAAMARLISRLSLPESVGLSLAVISPTVTAAFNITLVVQAAGPAAPLTFAIGTVAMTLVALSFMSFTHRVAHAGSAYAYIAHTFGSRMGFMAGWTLLLTYLGFGTGFAALAGSFTSAAIEDLGVRTGPLWLVVGGGSMLLAWWLAYRD